MIYLRASTKEEFESACHDAGMTDENGEIATSTVNYFIDLIGDIYVGTGEFTTDEEGNDREIKAAADGYHVNLVKRDGVELGIEHLEIEVNTPYRITAGY